MNNLKNEKVSRYILAKSSSEGFSNTIFFGIVLLLIILIGKKFELIGEIGFWAFAIIAGIDGLRLMFILVSGGILFFSKSKGPKAKAATFIQTLEFLLFLAYTIILYKIFFNS